MKAAQGPGVGGGLPLGAPTPGSHSPNHQSMHPGICLSLNIKLNVNSECNKNEFVDFIGGQGNNGSSSGSPSHFLPPGHSPTPSSTPVSELSPGKHLHLDCIDWMFC